MTDHVIRLDGLVPERLRPKTRKIVLEDYDLPVDIGDLKVEDAWHPLAHAAGHLRAHGLFQGFDLDLKRPHTRVFG